MIKKGISGSILLASLPQVWAHGESLYQEYTTRLLFITGIGGLVILSLTIYALLNQKSSEKTKKILFTTIAIATILTTLYLLGGTTYINSKSFTKGPVHWHADFEVWQCGRQLDVIDPQGISNKVGSTVVHEHGDSRIHIEGVLLTKEEGELQEFIESIGGEWTTETVKIPTDEGMQELKRCTKDAELQVFAYQTRKGQVSQRKLDDPKEYLISPYSKVPPGDCIIIEMDAPKEKTDKICSSYSKRSPV